MENRPLDRPVAELAGARIPADNGLASLGLVMQLGGSIFLGVSAFMALLPLFAGASLAGQPNTWISFLLGSLGALRSAFHRSAGSAIIYGSPAGPFRATRSYIVLSVITTALTLVVLSQQLDFGAGALVSAGVLLLAWPATLGALLFWPKLRRFADDAIPNSEDMGFEGIAVLMSLLGVLGVAFSGLVLLLIVKMPGGLASPHTLLYAGVFGMLLARSVMQARAGMQGARGVGPETASESASRYYSFGVVSSVVAGGAFMMEAMMSGALHPVSLLLVGTVIYWLLAWPLLVRRFFTERNFSVLLAGDDAPVFRRAPDAGLTALGWLLLALGVIGLADSLPRAIFGAGANMAMLSSLFGGDLAASVGRSQWWNVGVAAVQIWAAVELIRMTVRHKLATNIYGAVAAAVTLYVYWPLVQSLGHGALGGRDFEAVFRYGLLAISLVVPVGAVLLVNRKLTPEAQARLREDRD